MDPCPQCCFDCRVVDGGRGLDSLRYGERGQSLVEFALVLPILVYSLMGIFDLSRGYAMLLATQNGARAAAEATAVDFTPSASRADAQARQEMARTPGMDATAATVTMTMTDAGGATCTTSTLANPCFVTVRVQYTFRTITAWPGLPNTFAFDRSTIVRRFA